MKHASIKFREIIFHYLHFCTQQKLRRESYKKFGITGSSGKTSGKDCIATILNHRFRVQASKKNLNTEFGVIYSILDLKKPDTKWDWLFLCLQAGKKAFQKSSIEKLVLEMGVDRPGDMDKILEVYVPDVMIFLNVKYEHIDADQFKNREEILAEKSKACYALDKKTGLAILNADDSFVRSLKKDLACPILWFSTKDPEADLYADSIRSSQDGLSFILHYQGEQGPVAYPFKVPKILGAFHVPLILSGIACGLLEGMNVKEIQEALLSFELTPGRMNPIEGKNGSFIIDGSYNASEESMLAGLSILDEFKGRKIAVLGTMNELGERSDLAHRKVGRAAAAHADLVVCVGRSASILAESAHEAGLPASHIHRFENSIEAGDFLSSILEAKDIVFVKGSQNKVRLEHLVKKCMAKPEMASSLLCRQEPYWLRNLL